MRLSIDTVDALPKEAKAEATTEAKKAIAVKQK